MAAAYELLSDKDKRGQFDRGEIDETASRAIRLRAAAIPLAAVASGRVRAALAATKAWTWAILDGLFGGRGRGGTGRRLRRFRGVLPQKGANVAYRS